MNKDLQDILKALRKRGGESSGGINFDLSEEGALRLRGSDGYTPQKGIDYWTPEEVNETVTAIFKAAKPTKGVDYYTDTEKRQFVSEILKMATPVKGVHYRDGIDGKDGRDGKDADEIDARKVAIDAINFLESFEGDARLSAKALKDLDEAVTDILKKGADFELSEKQINTIKDLLPKYPPINAGGSGATFLKSLRDVDLSGLTKNADGKYVLGGGGSGASTFLGLTDTPSAYTGQAGKILAVNTGETAVEFIAPPSGSGDVVGPASSTADSIAVFNGLTGKVIKDGAATVAQVRDRSTHTGTQTAATISDFDTEVSNNTDVAANTTARHTHANKATLDNITAAYTTAEASKLAGIEALADVTDAGNVGSSIHGATAKTTPVDADTMPLIDSAAANVLKKVTWANIKATIKAYTDTLYAAALGADDNYVTDAEKVAIGTIGNKIDAIADPNADRILFWDDSAGAYAYLIASTGLIISTTSMTVRTSSATQTGIVELATDAETVTGTDTARATTPANITAKLAAPGAIGGTTPSTAQFTTVTTTGNIELGHASDTTISRSAAGVIAVEGVVIPSISSTNTLTNKRVTPRTGTTTSSATPTINTDNVDFYSLTAQAVDITSFTTNLSGTPTEGQKLWIAITGTAARSITWGASFENGPVALPTTTVTTTRLDVGFIWNSVTSKWRCVASGSTV